MTEEATSRRLQRQLSSDVPGFFNLMQESAILAIEETEPGDEGTYTVTLRSKILNYASTEIETSFKVMILPRSDWINPLFPFWKADIEDQEIMVGQSLQYKPEIVVISNGYLYKLKVRINRVRAFGSYDAESNTVLIDGKKVVDSDAGDYQVEYIGEFTNGASVVRK